MTMNKKEFLLLVSLLFTLLFSACAPNSAVSGDPAKTNGKPAVETAETADAEMTDSILEPTYEADVFLSVVLPVYENLDSYLGKEVSIDGFVMYRDTFDENELMVTRMLVECCFDDAAPTGFVSRWDGGALPEADEWVRVTGIIDQRQVTDPVTGGVFIQPYLIAQSLESIEPYESEYVFIEAD